MSDIDLDGVEPRPFRPALGPMAALAGLVGGVLAGERAGAAPATGALVAGGAGLAAAWFVTGRARFAVATLALALLGAATMQRALEGLERSPVAAVAEGTEVEVRGTLVTDPAGPRFRADALLRVDTFAPLGEPAAEQRVRRTVMVRATGKEAGRLRVLVAGDHVTLTGRLGPLDGFDTRYRWHHAVARLDGADVVAFAPPRGPLSAVANDLRSVVLRGIATLPTVERGLLGGFLLGDTRAVPADVVGDFRASGLSHLLAVSGANVAFVLALAGPLLRRLPLAGRLAGGLAVVLVFATATRYEPSVMRASALAAASLTANFAGRPTDPARLLALAVTALVLVDPFLVHSVAFMLSCGASAGIVLLSRPVAEWLRGPVWFRESLAVTLAAQLGVTPVLIPVFGSMPAVTPVANLLAAPLAGPITVYGLVAGAAGGLVGGVAPWLATILQWPSGALVHVTALVAHHAARVPFAIDGRGALAMLSLGALAAAWARARPAPWGRRAAGGSLRSDACRALPDPSPR